MTLAFAVEGVSRGPGRAGDFERKGGSGKSVVTGANATGSGRYGGAAAMSGGSFNSNFNQHRREWSVTMRNHDGDGGAARVGTLDGTFSSNGTAGHTSRDYPARGRSFANGATKAKMAGTGKGDGKGGKGGPNAPQLSSDDRFFGQYKKRSRR